LPRIHSIAEFPDILGAYFEIIHDILSVHPDHFFTLPVDAQSSILSSLIGGLSHPNATVAASSFQTAYRLCAFVLDLRHKLMLRPEHAFPRDSFTRLESQLLTLQQKFLEIMLLERFSEEVVDSMADALIALVSLNPGHFTTLVSSLLSQQESQALQSRLNALFDSLLTSNSVQFTSQPLERRNRFRFRSNLRIFLVSVRGILSKH
jgi:hypothetical protein